MRLLPSLEVATRLTRAGKLTEALAALARGSGLATTVQAHPAPPPAGGGGLAPALRTALQPTLDGALGMLGRLGAPHGLEGGTVPPQAPPGASFTEHSFAGRYGVLAYKLYRPACAGTRPLPLLVMLHGCTQSPDDFAAGTRMNARAEAAGFFVAYPGQSPTANAKRCWNWFRPGDQGRTGEPALVAGMTAEILRNERVDPARVYVAGLSAGGAAAAVLGQNYPDMFAAVGVHSGLACGAAADMPSAFAAMRSGALAPSAGVAVPTIVLHGDRDGTVSPVNGTQVTAQAASGETLTSTVETATAPGGLAYTRTVRADAEGRPLSEHWVLHGAGHAWSGGDPVGSYTDPRGPDASLAMLDFFRHHALRR